MRAWRGGGGGGYIPETDTKRRREGKQQLMAVAEIDEQVKEERKDVNTAENAKKPRGWHIQDFHLRMLNKRIQLLRSGLPTLGNCIVEMIYIVQFPLQL